MMQCCIYNTYSSEDNSNIAHKVVQQDIPFVILFLLYIHPDATLHHGILAHEHNTVLTQTLPSAKKTCVKYLVSA